MTFATVYKPCRVDGVSFEDAPSLTQSQFQADCDVNAMIRRALAGDLSVFRHPQYMDVLGAPEDFHEAANKTALARTLWENLSEEVRATYGSPEALLLDYDREVKRRIEADNAAKDRAEKRAEIEGAVKDIAKTASTSDAPTPTNT